MPLKIMKKLIIIILAIVSLNVFAQEVNMLQKTSITIGGEARVLTPHYFSYINVNLVDSCDFPFDSIDFCFHNCYRYAYWRQGEAWGVYYVEPIFDSRILDITEAADTIKLPRGYAQIMHNDTLLELGGVSFVLDLTNKPDAWEQPTSHSTIGDTVLIIDASTMDVLYEQVLNDTLRIDPFNHLMAGFYEVIFDSAVQVQDDYFIAYKYNPNNVLHNLISTLDVFNNPINYYVSGYSLPLSFFYSFDIAPGHYDGYLGHRRIDDYKTSKDQIYYYNLETGWLPCLNYRNYYSVPQNDYEGLTWIDGTFNIGLFTDLYPEDRTITPHTTDLGVFAIPEYAIDRQTDTGGFTSFLPLMEYSALTFTPNPTNDIVNVYCDYMMYFAEIYDLQGTKLEAKEINAYQTSLSLAKYPDGIYLMKINTDKGFITKRIIKQ